MKFFRPLVVIGLIATLAWLPQACASTDPAPDAEVWVLVETDSDRLNVMRGARPVKTFSHIALGRGGIASAERRRGDDKTPLGVFRVGWVNWNSPFHIFIGLNFPSWDYASRARKVKLIDDKTYYSIVDALLVGHTPPQNTVLGGNIGIHGLGDADPALHRAFNWTKGCIALTNEQVEELAGWVRPGTKVVIK